MPNDKNAGEQAIIDPLGAKHEDVIRLKAAPDVKMSTVGNAMSSRIPISFMDGDRKVEGFFTPASNLDFEHQQRAEFLRLKTDFPQYLTFLERFEERYSFLNSDLKYAVEYENGKSFSGYPLYDDLSLEELGYSDGEAEALYSSEEFKKFYKDNVTTPKTRQYYLYARNGVSMGETIDKRNVAMSEAAEILGVSSTIAKSSHMQIELDGKPVDGVFMEMAHGVDASHIKPGDPVALITKDQIHEVYDNPEALRSVADLQIEDFIAFIADRHYKNIIYQFEGLDTGKPKFLGVKGIDNDLSYLTTEPGVDKYKNRLPALKDIKVMTEQMAQRIQDPKIYGQMAEMMRKNDLPEKEIEKMKERIDMLKARMKTGQIQVVKDEEWKDLTFEKLAPVAKRAEDSSYFSMIRSDFILPNAKKAEKFYAQTPEEQQKILDERKTKNGLAFAELEKVDAFSKESFEKRHAEELTHAVRSEALSGVEKDMADLEGKQRRNNTLSDLDMLDKIQANVDFMKEILQDAAIKRNSSPQYDRMQKECEKLERMIRKAPEFTGKEDAESGELMLSAEQKRKIAAQIKKVGEAADGYLTYKTNALKGKKGNKTEQKRMNAANSVKDLSSELKTAFAKNSFERYNVFAQIKEEIKQEQKSVDQNTTRKELEEKPARIVYLKMLSNLDANFKDNQKTKMRAAMQGDGLERGAQKIMQDERGFGALRAMPDDKLRSLVTADDADQLYAAYINNIVRAKQNAETEKQKTDQISRRLFQKRDEMNQEKPQSIASKDDSSVAYTSGNRKPKGPAPKK